MNPHYTSETRTIFINSVQRTSGGDHDLVIKFGAVLPNEYERFYCETIDFYGQSIDVNFEIMTNRYCPSVDAFDFIENNYNSNEQYNGQTIAAAVTFHGGVQYIKRSQRIPYIVKNFNNKSIRFALRSVKDTYTGREYGGMRNWTLIMSVTPIKDELKDTLPYHISNKKYESFTYSFGSNQLISGHPGDCIVQVPAITDNYNSYFVDVKIMQNTQNLIAFEDYILLFCEGWSETEYSPYGQIIGGLVDASTAAQRFDSNPTSDNAVFVIINMKHRRNVRFKLLYNDLTLIPQGIIDAGYTWYVNCLITPINQYITLIYMNTLQSFTYTITSASGDIDGLTAEDVTINIGPLRETYEYYYVSCTSFGITTNSLTGASAYYHLVADDLAENGYFAGLNNNQCILGTLYTTVNIGCMTSGEGSHIKVKNMRQKRQIRFRLYGPDMQPIDTAQCTDGTYWSATLLFTPIM